MSDEGMPDFTTEPGFDEPPARDEMYPVMLADAVKSGHLTTLEAAQQYALHELAVGDGRAARLVAAGLDGSATAAPAPPALLPNETAASDAESEGEGAVAPAPLPFISLSAFVERRAVGAERAPLVGSATSAFLVIGGLIVVGGLGGSGKTTFTLDALAHFASATPWMGLTVDRPLRILIIDIEGPREPLRQKIEAKIAAWQGAPFADNVWILDGEPWGQFSFASEDCRHRLRAAIAELHPDLVVANPTGRLGVEGGGTPEEVGRFVGWLRDCGLWNGVAFWLLHHFNRGLSRDVLMRLSGAWDRDADTILGLAHEGPQRTKLSWAKFRWALDGGPEAEHEILEWDIPTLGYRRIELAERSNVTAEEVRERTLTWLQENAGWHSTSAVRDAVQGTNDVIDATLRGLFEDGLIALSVAVPGKPLESVAEELWGDWRRLKARKYWMAHNHAGLQSPLPLTATDGDQGAQPPEEEVSRRVAAFPVGEATRTATDRRGSTQSAAEARLADAPANRRAQADEVSR